MSFAEKRVQINEPMNESHPYEDEDKHSQGRSGINDSDDDQVSHEFDEDQSDRTEESFDYSNADKQEEEEHEL